MAITFNGKNIDIIDYNETNIDTVTYNGTIVFETLVDYTFPNENAKMTSDDCLDINTYFDARNSSSQSAYKAFDNDLATGYALWKDAPTTQTFGQIAIVFPFSIYIQSITIKNISSEMSNFVGGLKKGCIYISTAEESERFAYANSSTTYEYVSLDRSSVASTHEGETEHTNEAYKTTAIRSISIRGTEWNNKNWHMIGEVKIKFKVGSGTLNTWKSTHGIS